MIVIKNINQPLRSTLSPICRFL